jgi:hypothetical protein
VRDAATNKGTQAMKPNPQAPSDIILYQTDDGRTRLEVQLQDETVWLSQAQMAELFQTSVPNVSMHIRNVFAEGELQAASVVKESLTTAADGKDYLTKYYNLDVIISVGYRVKSNRGTQFRIWATQRLREYLIKGFTMDDERLKRLGGGNYFEELLARIRDIRSSEKVFWRKVLEIYATSEPLVQLAVESDARLIVTHNVRDLQPATRLGVEVLQPREFLAKLRL